MSRYVTRPAGGPCGDTGMLWMGGVLCVNESVVDGSSSSAMRSSASQYKSCGDGGDKSFPSSSCQSGSCNAVFEQIWSTTR